MAGSVIRAMPLVEGEGWAERRVVLVHDGQESLVTFRFTHPRPDTLAPSLRVAALALLLPAMRVGGPVVLDGPIDAVSVDGLREWQEAVATWHPTLRPVPLLADPDPAPPSPPSSPGGVTAFSGGVDSCFTVERHATAPSDHRALTYRTAPLAAGVMVHGFDIPLDQPDVFASAFARSAAILDSYGLAAHQVRTDLRALEPRYGIDWEAEAHGIWLAAALACVEDGATHTVIPSTYPYDQQRLPWASNPLTDPLLGSASCPLWHDGAAFDKLDKVAAIAGRPEVAQHLRVCWQGARLDRNCGRCFKCVVTQACFWLSGGQRPPCFDVVAGIDEVAALDLKDPYKVHLGRRLRHEAEAQGCEELAGALATALARVGGEVR